jgi:hypothetical protein
MLLSKEYEMVFEEKQQFVLKMPNVNNDKKVLEKPQGLHLLDRCDSLLNLYQSMKTTFFFSL